MIGFIITIIVIVPVAYLLIRRSNIKDAQAENKRKSDLFESKIIESGFNIEKRIEHLETSTLFFVDGAAKKWALKTFQNDYGVFSFKDVESFQLVENNESVATATINSIFAGGIYAGDKVIHGVCGMMEIHVTLDSLKNPHVVIPLIVVPVEKSTEFYKKSLSDAYEMTSTLSYIISHKN